MRLLFLVLFSVFFSLNAWADNSYEPLLDTVTLELNAEQWVVTQSALVTVGVNASVTGGGLDKTQNTIMTKLNQFSNKGVWRIVSFNRSLNQSGLEQIQIAAQARLPSSDLAGLRDKVKAISKPGETYTLDNVEFVPSEIELRDANTNLRAVIYQQAKNELATLAKFYPDQRYYIHRIDFINRSNPQPMNAMYMKAAMTSAASNISSSVSVGNKLVLAAIVVLAAAPTSDVAKIVHA